MLGLIIFCLGYEGLKNFKHPHTVIGNKQIQQYLVTGKNKFQICKKAIQKPNPYQKIVKGLDDKLPVCFLNGMVANPIEVTKRKTNNQKNGKQTASNIKLSFIMLFK